MQTNKVTKQREPHSSASVRSSELLCCGWRQDEWHGYWDTKCGEAFDFENGTPDANHFRFCPGCGRLIRLGKPKTST